MKVKKGYCTVKSTSKKKWMIDFILPRKQVMSKSARVGYDQHWATFRQHSSVEIHKVSNSVAESQSLSLEKDRTRV